MVANMSDDDIWRSTAAATTRTRCMRPTPPRQRQRPPTVILAKTMKGYGMGEAGEAMNITHQAEEDGPGLHPPFRDRLGIPIPTTSWKVPYRPSPRQPGMAIHARPRMRAGRLPAGARR